MPPPSARALRCGAAEIGSPAPPEAAAGSLLALDVATPAAAADGTMGAGVETGALGDGGGGAGRRVGIGAFAAGTSGAFGASAAAIGHAATAGAATAGGAAGGKGIGVAAAVVIGWNCICWYCICWYCIAGMGAGCMYGLLCMHG